MGKYDKYFITRDDTPPNPIHPVSRNKGNLPWENYMYINDEINGAVKNAFYMEPNLVLGIQQGESIMSGHGKPHNHAFDEYLVWLGTNPNDLDDLGGEVEFWIEDEKHMITRSTTVFVPAGIYHLPMQIHRVDRPFIFLTTGNTIRYRHLSYHPDPKYKDYFQFNDSEIFPNDDTVYPRKHVAHVDIMTGKPVD